MIRILAQLLLLISGLQSNIALAELTVPGKTWNVETAIGWNQAKLDEARLMFESLDSSALMVVHRGRLVVNWGETDQKVNVASVRKSLLSSLYGIAWDRGLVDLHNTLEQLDINDTDHVLTEQERQASIEHLLLSRSGVFHSALYDAGWYKLMPERGSYKPGEFWIYNNWDFNALGTIFQKVTDWTIHEAFDEHIATPLQMQDYDPADVSYESRENFAERFRNNTSDHRLYLFHFSARDLARFGLLYLNRGQWAGKQVLSEGWIEKSTEGKPTGFESRRFNTKYGYLWWIDEGNQRRLKISNETSKMIIASGARGHYLVIAPAYEMVVVHATSTTRGASAWDQIARRYLGAPDVADWQFSQLLALLLSAQPAI